MVAGTRLPQRGLTQRPVNWSTAEQAQREVSMFNAMLSWRQFYKVGNTQDALGSRPKATFIITVYREEPELLDHCLRNLRRHYRKEPVVIITDGTFDRMHPIICKRHRCGYVPGARLKTAVCGIAWWERFIRHAVYFDAPYTFKMDPDTVIHRRFQHFPQWDLFGSLRGSVLQGGIIGLQAHACRVMDQSGVFQDPSLWDWRTWAAGRGIDEYILSRGEMSTDHSLAYLARRLGLTFGDWPEVDSMWRVTRPFRPGVAATHPHKLPTNTRTSSEEESK